MDKLKRCPFCGGEAAMVDLGIPRNPQYVQCRKCHVKMTGLSYGEEETAHEAAQKWNRRIKEADDISKTDYVEVYDQLCGALTDYESESGESNRFDLYVRIASIAYAMAEKLN